MPTVTSGAPAIDYTSKDYASFLSDMISYAQTAFPEWTNQNPGALEVMLLESLARELDVLSYYGDRIVGEAYIGTATQKSSMLLLANLLGYTPGQSVASTGTVTFMSDASTTSAIVIPPATQVTTNYVDSLNSPLIFETTSLVTIPSGGSPGSAPVIQGVTQGSSVFTIDNFTANPYSITTELLGTSNGNQLQVFTLANNPVVSGSITIYLENPTYPTTSGVDPILPWNQVASLQYASSSDQVWSQSTDATGVVSINFGDGINGAIPPSGLAIYANYRVGGGVIGNIASNSIVDIAAPISGITITASSAMTGGADPETIDQIRVNAPRAYTTQQRAVTLSDFANLAMSLPSVAQANAVANTYTNVTVYVVGPGGVLPAQATLDSITSYLQPLSLAGAIVTATAASLVPIQIGSSASPVLIGCSSRYSPAAITAQATQALQNMFSLGSVSLGGRVTLSGAYSTLLAIPGVETVNIPVFVRSDAISTSAADILMRSYELPTAGNIYLNVSPSFF